MDSQYSEIDLSDSSSSIGSTNFTLKLSSDENDNFILEVSASDDDIKSDHYNSSKESGIMSSLTTRTDDNRSPSPVFEFKMFKRKITNSRRLLDDKLKLSYNKVEAYLKNTSFLKSEDENKGDGSSSESEIELHHFKKIGNQTNRELFSPDNERILAEESRSTLEKSGIPKRRITRSESLRRKKSLQKEIFESFKESRSKKIKALLPFISTRVEPGKSSKKLLRRNLREMILFTFL